MPLLQGSTFLNKPLRGLKTHLWVVLSDPNFDNNAVVIVNVTTWRDCATNLNDSSCILEAGEHPFIKQKSYIYYREAVLTPMCKILNGFSGGVLEAHDNCTTELLEKILLGASQSEHTPLKIIGALQAQGLID